MLRKMIKIFGLTALMAVTFTLTGLGQDNIVKVYDNDDYDRGSYNGDNYKIDRYLTVEIWPNHTDGEYFEGDNIVLNFLTNRDAFVAIYSVDSRGRVNMLFPGGPDEDNFVRGGETYQLPGDYEDYDFVVSGPEGVENIQIIASRERFPIPDWYPTSGLVDDWEDRFEFMDYINGNYFIRYDGQRFAFDRTAIYINEWEPEYYRPVYYPHYPSWTVSGNVYIDYPYGGTVYINGIYWGIAPLYIPRIYVGWHTVTIYDYYGYCWESDIHISRYNTVVLNRTIVNPRPTVVSKYKDVRVVGYRDPVKSGYPKFVSKKTTVVDKNNVKSNGLTDVITKKYARGSTKIVKTGRGYETVGRKVVESKKSVESRSMQSETTKKKSSSSEYKSRSGYEESSGSEKRVKSSKSDRSSKSSGVVKKKSSSKDAPKAKSSSDEKKSIEKRKKSKSDDAPNKSSSSKKIEKKSSSSKSSDKSPKSSDSKKSTSKKSGGKKKDR